MARSSPPPSDTETILHLIATARKTGSCRNSSDALSRLSRAAYSLVGPVVKEADRRTPIRHPAACDRGRSTTAPISLRRKTWRARHHPALAFVRDVQLAKWWLITGQGTFESHFPFEKQPPRLCILRICLFSPAPIQTSRPQRLRGAQEDRRAHLAACPVDADVDHSGARFRHARRPSAMPRQGGSSVSNRRSFRNHVCRPHLHCPSLLDPPRWASSSSSTRTGT